MLISEATNLVKDYEQFQVGVTALTEKFSDTSIALDERWTAFTTLVNNDIFINIACYGDGFIDTLGSNLTIYDHFHIDRHQTMTYAEMYDFIMEADGDYQRALVEARESNLDAWREAVLASGYSGFDYDW